MSVTQTSSSPICCDNQIFIQMHIIMSSMKRTKHIEVTVILCDMILNARELCAYAILPELISWPMCSIKHILLPISLTSFANSRWFLCYYYHILHYLLCLRCPSPEVLFTLIICFVKDVDILAYLPCIMSLLYFIFLIFLEQATKYVWSYSFRHKKYYSFLFLSSTIFFTTF